MQPHNVWAQISVKFKILFRVFPCFLFWVRGSWSAVQIFIWFKKWSWGLPTFLFFPDFSAWTGLWFDQLSWRQRCWHWSCDLGRVVITQPSPWRLWDVPETSERRQIFNGFVFCLDDRTQSFLCFFIFCGFFFLINQKKTVAFPLLHSCREVTCRVHL